MQLLSEPLLEFIVIKQAVMLDMGKKKLTSCT